MWKEAMLKIPSIPTRRRLRLTQKATASGIGGRKSKIFAHICICIVAFALFRVRKFPPFALSNMHCYFLSRTSYHKYRGLFAEQSAWNNRYEGYHRYKRGVSDDTADGLEPLDQWISRIEHYRLDDEAIHELEVDAACEHDPTHEREYHLDSAMFKRPGLSWRLFSDDDLDNIICSQEYRNEVVAWRLASSARAAEPTGSAAAAPAAASGGAPAAVGLSATASADGLAAAQARAAAVAGSDG